MFGDDGRVRGMGRSWVVAVRRHGGGAGGACVAGRLMSDRRFAA